MRRLLHDAQQRRSAVKRLSELPCRRQLPSAGTPSPRHGFDRAQCRHRLLAAEAALKSRLRRARVRRRVCMAPPLCSSPAFKSHPACRGNSSQPGRPDPSGTVWIGSPFWTAPPPLPMPAAHRSDAACVQRVRIQCWVCFSVGWPVVSSPLELCRRQHRMVSLTDSPGGGDQVKTRLSRIAGRPLVDDRHAVVDAEMQANPSVITCNPNRDDEQCATCSTGRSRSATRMHCPRRSCHELVGQLVGIQAAAPPASLPSPLPAPRPQPTAPHLCHSGRPAHVRRSDPGSTAARRRRRWIRPTRRPQASPCHGRGGAPSRSRPGPAGDRLPVCPLQRDRDWNSTHPDPPCARKRKSFWIVSSCLT
jgi:hypothetical protein